MEKRRFAVACPCKKLMSGEIEVQRMTKRPDYDFITEIETPTQKKTSGLAKKLLADMKRIDAVVASGNFEQLRDLHVELDGTYQNRIKNWGSSMYNYMKDMGFVYEYIDEESLRHNLKTMKAKMRGLLFEIDPSAEVDTEQKDTQHMLGEYRMNAKQKRLLSDYAKIKQCAAGNMAISIQAEDYPRYKDTLDYMVEYEYITPLDIDFGANHMYIKQPSFDSFTENVLTQEMEEKPMATAYNNKKVFVVHGHDHTLLDEVELMLRRIGLDPVIVKNEANSGRTIIQKIADLSDVGFGIILYTCCDEGRKKGDSELKDRARQNVIFEHGYLYAKLGPGRVAALNDSGIEIPSDLSGVLYVPRSAPDWKNQLMREMRAAGLDFESTRA